MKKLLLLTLICSAIVSTNSFAQAGDPPSVLEQMKQKTVPAMVEKTGLSTAQAEKIVELNYEMRMSAAGLKDLPEAERMEKIKELKAAKEKKFSEFLTPEQIASVKAFYEDMGKNKPAKGGK